MHIVNGSLRQEFMVRHQVSGRKFTPASEAFTRIEDEADGEVGRERVKARDDFAQKRGDDYALGVVGAAEVYGELFGAWNFEFDIEEGSRGVAGNDLFEKAEFDARTGTGEIPA